METISIFTILVLLCNNGATVYSTELEDSITDLQLVQVLFRHGDRNPVDPYPNDPYRNESFWPEGFGQLTKVGKVQQYQLGKYLRTKYNGYISDIYSPYEIFVQSSDVDRTLMSAQANLAGLYPPTDNRSLWNPSLIWQPIPVHSEPVNIDNKLKLSAPCPRYTEIYDQFLNNSPIMKSINAENRALYDLLTNYSGRTIKDPVGVDFLYDTLHIESLYNYKLPDWTKSVYPDQMTNLTAFSFQMVTYTAEMQRLKGGPLLKEMIKNMQERVSKKLDARRKIFMYSAHDTTISALLNTIGVFEVISPPYASLVTLELHKKNDPTSSEQFYIKILFRNDTTRDPYVLQVPGCQLLCPLNEFIELTKSKVPDDWEKECRKGGRFYNLSGLSIAALTLGSIVAALLALSMLVMTYIKHRRKNPKPPQYPYLHLQMEDEEA